MKQRRIILLTAFSSWLLLCGVGVFFLGHIASLHAAPALQAVNIRGRIVRQVNNRPYPAGRVQVRLKGSSGNGSAQIAFTASDGMYSFRNISPGSYVIEVLSGRPERVIRSLPVQIPNRPTVDIPQITL